MQRKTLSEDPGSPSAHSTPTTTTGTTTSTPISMPSQTSSSEEVRVTKPVTKALDEYDEEKQLIQTEKETEKDKINVETMRIMTDKEVEDFTKKMIEKYQMKLSAKENEIENVKQCDDDDEDKQCDDDDEDDNDNLSAAKVWARHQKQSCIK